MRLNREQRDYLKQLVASGLPLRDINDLAGRFDPPFRVSRQQADGYRLRTAPIIAQLIEQNQDSPLVKGLAVRENRVALLQELAELMRRDLIERQKTWITGDVRLVGKGAKQQVVEFEQFNHAEVSQLRGILDDLARETGGRINKQDVDVGGDLTIEINWHDDLTDQEGAGNGSAETSD